MLPFCVNGQFLANPGFESNGSFSISGWNWFCSSPEYAETTGHSGCCALLLPTWLRAAHA